MPNHAPLSVLYELCSIPYELRLGVTGHRTLADLEAVKKAVIALLDEVNGLLNRQSQTPLTWTVISALAKGADHIVAEAVLQRPGAHLEVITPFALDEYRHDFADPADRAKFEVILNKKNSLVELNPGPTFDATDPKQRNHAYFQAGRAVVDRCELLIAVWNGQPAAGRRGIGEIVNYALQSGRTVLWINSEDPTARSRWLVRKKHHHATPAANSRFWKAVPLPKHGWKLSPSYFQLATFVSDAHLAPADWERAIQETTATVRDCAEKAGLAPARIDPLLLPLVPYYAWADQLAICYQQKHVRSVIGVSCLAALAVSIAVMQVLFALPVAFISLEILAMLALLVLLGLHRFQGWHNQWLTNRHLAEHLRTTLFTLLAGEDPCGRLEQASKLLPFYMTPDRWLLATLRCIIPEACTTPITGADPATLKRFIIDAWLTDQQRFHARNAVRKENRIRQSRWGVGILFGTTLIMALLHLLNIGHGHEANPLLSPAQWFTFLAVVLPAWGAAVHAIGKQLEYERIAARSEQMARVLSRYVERAEAAFDLNDLRQIVRQAARVIGLENYEWWVLLSFEQPELVV